MIQINTEDDLEVMHSEALKSLRLIQDLVDHRPNQPPYQFLGRLLEWGKDMPEGCLESMKRQSEVCLLLDRDRRPHAYIYCDQYGAIREQKYGDPLHHPSKRPVRYVVDLSQKQSVALLRLAEMQELSPERVLMQALAAYELQVFGLNGPGCPNPE